MTQYIGIDLAWGEGTARKHANESGLAMIDESGAVIHAGWARGIDAVAEWVTDVAEPGAVIAIDAPLVIPNASGMRLCERQVGMGYGRWHVAANASNAVMGWKGGVALRERLEASGFEYSDGVAPASEPARTMFECYPYTTIVGAVELGYDDRRPRYKRLDKALPTAEARAHRAIACDDLIRRVASLDSADPPLVLSSHEVTRPLIDEPSPLIDAAYKHREDVLDAVLCAWTAALWHRFGDTRVQVLGRDDEPDASGRRATIIAPTRDEQRVAGRTMRRLGSPVRQSMRTPSGSSAVAAIHAVRSAAKHLGTVDSIDAGAVPEFDDAWTELLAQRERLLPRDRSDE